MGYASYDCAHCGHPILDPGWTTRFVNDWMSKGVILLEDGSRIIGTMDDEAHTLGRFDWGDLYGEPMVFAHFACWREAGKPEYDGYAKPSEHSDQANLSHEGHDIPEPGSLVDRRLWDAAIRLRRERARRETVRKVAEFLNPPEYKEEEGGVRFQADFLEEPEGGRPDYWPERLQPGWCVEDRAFIADLDDFDGVYAIASEEEAKALADELNRKWVEGEGAQMLAEFRSWQQHYFDKWAAELRASGVRFKAEKHPYHGNSNWRVKDYDDYTLDLQFSDPEDAKRKAKELNDQWLANGMPIDKHSSDEWDHPMDFLRCRLGYDDPDALPIFAAEDEDKKKKR